MIRKDSNHHHKRDDLNRIGFTSFPYLTLTDVKKIYCVINDWSAKGLEQFAKKAREIAVKVPGERTEYVYQFRNEEALFELFQTELPRQMERHGITCFGKLMQFIS